MKRYIYGEFSITLRDTGKVDDMGKSLVRYALRKNGKVIFSGDDLSASPLHEPESRQTAGAVLAFACDEGSRVTESNLNAQDKRLNDFLDNDAESLYIWQEELDA